MSIALKNNDSNTGIEKVLVIKTASKEYKIHSIKCYLEICSEQTDENWVLYPEYIFDPNSSYTLPNEISVKTEFGDTEEYIIGGIPHVKPTKKLISLRSDESTAEIENVFIEKIYKSKKFITAHDCRYAIKTVDTKITVKNDKVKTPEYNRTLLSRFNFDEYTDSKFPTSIVISTPYVGYQMYVRETTI
jgi:hypothetical protein